MQSPSAAAAPVDPDLRARILAASQGALMLNLAYIGVTNRLFAALSAGPQNLPQLQQATGADLAYLLRWSDAAVAFGLLDRDQDQLSLAALGRAFLAETPGSLMPVALGSVLSSHMAERAAALMPSGDRPGESVLTECESLRPWFGTMLEVGCGPVFQQAVLPALPAVQAVGEEGGLVVDLGCGSGWYLRLLLARYPKLTGVGMDMVPESIAVAAQAAAAEGLSHRLRFQLGDLQHFDVDEPVALLVMNRALHHVWGADPAPVMARIHRLLAPGGRVLFWEPRWPDDTATLATDARRRSMAFQNLMEHVQGNRLLGPDEVEAALVAAGFTAERFLFAEGNEMILSGLKAS